MARLLTLALIWPLLLTACGAGAPTPTPEPVTRAEVVPTSTPTATPEPPRPTDTPAPTDTPQPTNTPAPTSTPPPTNTPVPTSTPVPTRTPTSEPAISFAITDPAGAVTVNTPTLNITGVGLPGMEFVRDVPMGRDQVAVVGPDGTWTMPVGLEPGLNELRFRETTTDIEAVVHVTYEVPPTATPKPTDTPRPTATSTPTPRPTSTPTPRPTSTPTPEPKPARVQPGGPSYPVLEVVDGDTIRIGRNGAEETLRLIGLDTPETKDPRKPVQCFGREASARAKQLLGGERVRIAQDPTQDTRDKYGRLLVYVWRTDGMFYNYRTILDGYAHEYTYDVPYQYQAQFRTAEWEARENGRGFWSARTCGGDTKQPADPLPVPPTPTPVPPEPPPPSGGNCDPSYPGVCIPPYPPDLDCKDVDAGNFVVRPPDDHGFDGDGDGYGCESN